MRKLCYVIIVLNASLWETYFSARLLFLILFFLISHDIFNNLLITQQF